MIPILQQYPRNDVWFGRGIRLSIDDVILDARVNAETPGAHEGQFVLYATQLAHSSTLSFAQTFQYNLEMFTRSSSQSSQDIK